MTPIEQRLYDLNITPTEPLINLIKNMMAIGYATACMGLSTTTLDDLQAQWFEEKKEGNGSN
ncbi:hypothetical protein UFOVP129_4 [uncultured Caudovirales phage]|uniref:Uncharacterized protein n=1 Tax=uncultured Caudovirales phage TaxID=2100421 RepID=A0A6J5L7H6_9CAUD|nr:hypothetical protein UFOVP129_4 [uncultured Caudovirales phage]